MEVYADVLRKWPNGKYTPEILAEVVKAIMGPDFGKPLADIPGHVLAGILKDAGWHSGHYQSLVEENPERYEPRWDAAISFGLDLQMYVASRIR